MKFIDEAIIEIRAGKGGAGATSFRREKFVPMGGPDGGDGGAGGSVILIADRNRHTLLDFKFQPRWHAEDGDRGRGGGKSGKSGGDLRVQVPIGTVILNAESGDVVADMTEDKVELVLAHGGRGGKGNTFFKTSTNQAPMHAQPGEEGEHGSYRLSLKLVADVGLVGFPNAGKSTLISRLSAARPKIADYPFTTLEPNLGVVKAKGGRDFVIADIPGLIPGAHEGRGLGITFLKHIERTKIIAHLIDPHQLDQTGERIDPLVAFETINQELVQFSDDLAQMPQLVVLTKADAISDRTEVEAAGVKFAELGYQWIVISSASGEGLEELVELLASKITEARQKELSSQEVEGIEFD